MTFVYDVNEIFNEVLCATFILFNDFFLTVGIQGGIVIFMLPKFAHVVRIDASLLVYAQLALDNAIYVTLRLVVERAVRQHTGNGRHIPLWCGDGSVYRLNHTAWLVVSFLIHRVRLDEKIPLVVMVNGLAQLHGHLGVR